MQEKKFCPLMSRPYVDTTGDWPTAVMYEAHCREEQCGWWSSEKEWFPDKDESEGRCAIKEMAMSLYAIYAYGTECQA